MNFDDIFEAYYTQYRGETTIPASTEDEYIIGMRLANEAVGQWEGYDNTFWKELFTTAQTNSAGGVVTIATGTKTYNAPTDFASSGGFVRVNDSNGNAIQLYGIIEPHEAQFKDDNSTYAYFTQGRNYYSTGTASQSGTTITGSGTTWTSAMVGMTFTFSTGETATITAFGTTTSLTASVSQTVSSTTYQISTTNGTVLHLNPSPPSSLNGLAIDYVYYKKATLFDTGSSRTDMSDPYYIVYRMLANRYRVSRNPYYNSALRDAEDALANMKMVNDSGNWANPWKVTDNSGAQFGSGQPSSFWGW